MEYPVQRLQENCPAIKQKSVYLEKEEDVCCGTSKANSGIVHAGYDAKEGSLMAKLNVRGNAMMEQLSKDLDFPFKRIGSLVICLREEDMDKITGIIRQRCGEMVYRDFRFLIEKKYLR